MQRAEGNKEHCVTTHCSNPHCYRKTLQEPEKPPAPPLLYEELTFTHQMLELAHLLRQSRFSSKQFLNTTAAKVTAPVMLHPRVHHFSLVSHEHHIQVPALTSHAVIIQFQPPIVFTFLLITIKTNSKR